MKDEYKNEYIRRSLKDYSMSFKLSVVGEIQEEGLTPTEVAKKYGIQSRSTIRDWLEKFETADERLKKLFVGSRLIKFILDNIRFFLIRSLSIIYH